MFKFLYQNIFSKHRQEKFFRELKVNGFRSAAKKTIYFLKISRQPLNNQPLDITALSNTQSYFAQLFLQAFKSGNYVSLKIDHAPVTLSDIKLIAFYLPQFHPIQENDQWWGQGFTEWTNVTKAVPQFIGHYQPHLPDYLGFYDLRLKIVQQQQIELAKQYGVYGFCYHHYWFNKKKVLETPLENVLKNPDLDFPFCINWANENWTRRWDGLEQDILLSQNHSEEDDIAFIIDVARYMRDPRYIRINGKPLLIIYRPALLPDIRATAKRWRKWCRENSVGEIYLALTHSFEYVNPVEVGFDAAIEYAPNTFPTKSITENIIAAGKLINPFYQGSIHDYNQAAEYGEQHSLPIYKKFRGIFPGWDNEARRPGRGITFINATPLRFQQWLSKLLAYTQEKFIQEERLIFVNAWNEWGEGAHLEPDRKHGFGFLEACRVASQLHTLKQEINEQQQILDAEYKVAIVIHAFYLNIFEKILAYLNPDDSHNFKLFVSTPENQLESVHASLAKSGFDFTCYGVTNHGRDILPFINILPDIYAQKIPYLIKVHTKKSAHRADGVHWRNDLYNKLLESQNLKTNIQFLHDNLDTGILAPEGHLVPMSYYLSTNEQALNFLSARLGLDQNAVRGLHFAAGTMFSARTLTLMPLLLLNLETEDFESEQGQVDGTLAHAIERLFPVCAYRLGFLTRTLSNNTNENYAYAEKTNISTNQT
jgi:lipopolysaccharide biosynthesis protein